MNQIKQFLILLIELFFKFYFGFVGKPKMSENLRKTLELYKQDGFFRFFNIIRIWDTPFEEIEKIVPKSGVIVDLGSGDGLLGNFLAISSSQRKVLGFEINRERVKNSPNIFNRTSFKLGDVLKTHFPKADVIMLIHVLHHLNSYNDQEKLIDKCKDNLKPGGKLVIAEIIERPFLKFVFTAFTDYLILPILFENKLFSRRIYFRRLEGWKNLLRESGFSATNRVINNGAPFSHVIIEARTK